MKELSRHAHEPDWADVLSTYDFADIGAYCPHPTSAQRARDAPARRVGPAD